MGAVSEHNILVFLLQLALLLGLARGLGEVFRKWKQPPVTAEMIVGIVLGPTIIGRFYPGFYSALFPAEPVQEAMLETVAWLGVFFLLLDAGLQIDFSSAWRQKGDALKIALSDIIIPMLIAFVPFMLLPERYLAEPGQRIIFALFMATVSTISALPLTVRALHDLNIMKTDLGFLIMSALSVNDIIGWIVFTSVLGIAVHATVEIAVIFLLLGGTIAFTIIFLTFGRSFAGKVISKIVDKGFPEPASSLTFISLFGMLGGAITQRIGVHALFGFFIAGIAAGGAKALSEKTRTVISQMVYAIFVPIFFASIGLGIDFIENFDFFIVLLVTAIGIAGRFYGAWVGVSVTNQPRENRLAISIAHTPGGEMAIIVGTVAMGFGIITAPVFVAIMTGAIVSSVAVGPWLNHAVSRRKEVTLLRYFSKSGIIPELKSSTRDEAIRELSEAAARHPRVPEVNIVYSYVIEREEQMGTALENNIAIPHARFPALERPAVIFGRSTDGIDWNSPDGKPAHFIFLILSRQDGQDVQVQILSSLVNVLSDESIRKSLMKVKNSNQLWNILRKAFLKQKIKK